VFDDQTRAQQAINDLRTAGFTDAQLGYAVRNASTTVADAPGAPTAGNTVAGAVAGGAIGALIGAGAALLIPGIGPIVAGGILAAALTGGAIGAVAGGLLGALTDMGVPENEARFYQQQFEAGRAVVTVQAGPRAQEAWSILQRHGAYNATMQSAAVPAMPATQTTQRSWATEMPYYRNAWQQRYGATGRWDDYAPAYQYGWELANNPTYRGQAWTQVEPQLRRDWETRYPNMPWTAAAPIIRQTATTAVPYTTSTTQPYS